MLPNALSNLSVEGFTGVGILGEQPHSNVPRFQRPCKASSEFLIGRGVADEYRLETQSTARCRRRRSTATKEGLEMLREVSSNEGLEVR